MFRVSAGCAISRQMLKTGWQVRYCLILSQTCLPAVIHNCIPAVQSCITARLHRPTYAHYLWGCRFCSFSPCIEQVQRTCEALERNGFVDLQTIECLLRVWSVQSEKLSNDFGLGEAAAGQGASLQGNTQVVTANPEMDARGHTGYLTFARKWVG